jgi:hypothetical protein
LFGSLPTKTEVPSAPVAGSISVTELPPAPAREGTLANSFFDCLS